jgi:hypothetical protein
LTRDGIDDLKKSIIATAMANTYQKKIPAVWLHFETNIKKHDEPWISYEQITKIAEQSGIFEPEAILEAVLFLNDLGSLSYFDNKTLKDRVIIDPQWIVDVMSCVVSIKENVIKDGRLLHKDINEIWDKYDSNLQKWLLKLK